MLKEEIDDQTVRWVLPTNIHLTLKFLGEIPENDISCLQEQLEPVVITLEQFTLQVQNVGAFPSLHRPRVIWVGINNIKELIDLQAGVETVTQKLGYDSEDRPFSAHLTVGRINRFALADQISHCGKSLVTCGVGGLGSFIVQSVDIYRSDLSKEGSIYTKLHALLLKQAIY